MTQAENERLGVVETEVKYLRGGLSEVKESVESLRAEIRGLMSELDRKYAPRDELEQRFKPLEAAKGNIPGWVPVIVGILSTLTASLTVALILGRR